MISGSGIRNRQALLPAALVLMVLSTLVLPTFSEGRFVPRDGLWGGFGSTVACVVGDGCDRTSETGYFKIRARAVKEVGYNVVVACYNRETRESNDRYFTVDEARVSKRLNSAGVARFSQVKSSDGRSGEVNVTIDFSGARPVMKLRLRVSGRVERCNGLATFRVRSGRF